MRVIVYRYGLVTLVVVLFIDGKYHTGFSRYISMLCFHGGFESYTNNANANISEGRTNNGLKFGTLVCTVLSLWLRTLTEFLVTTLSLIGMF